MDQTDYKVFKEYQAIKAVYGDQCAKRSGIPLINHIEEGIRILQLIKASDDAIKAYCLHPIWQADDDLRSNFELAAEHDPYIVMLAMEYRNIANAYLRSRDPAPRSMRQIAVSPLSEVNQMLIADKIQNFKDFMRYHRQTHRHSDELYQYFKNWFDKLGIPEEVFYQLEADSTQIPEGMLVGFSVVINTDESPIKPAVKFDDLSHL